MTSGYVQSPVARLRGYRRLPDILLVLLRYGFRDVVDRVGLSRFIPADAREEHVPAELTTAVRLRHALEDLGPTFIKLGQVLATRPDLVPPAWASEFRRLQAAGPQVPYDQIAERLRDQFGERLDTLFPSIEERPIAAASIAQVHRAVLHDGSGVVLKILKPGVEHVLESDLELMRILAGFVEEHFSNLGYSPSAVVEEFAAELRREINFVEEAKATERLRRYFEQDPDVQFPQVYRDATTSKVLTLEEIHGTLLLHADVAALAPAERTRIVQAGARAVFRMCLEYGFFHADPHPGNIFVLEGGRICFIDCGMTGQLDLRTTNQLADLVAGVVAADLDRVIAAALGLSGADPMLAESREFRTDAWHFISRFSAMKLGEVRMGELLEEFFSTLRKHRVKCPSDLVLLIKAISTIESVGREIDPTFDLVRYVQPHIEQLIASRYGWTALRKRLERSAMQYVEFVETLPHNVQAIADRLRQNRFSVQLEHRKLDELTDTVEHSSRNIAHAAIISALLIASSILILSERISGTGGVLSGIGIAGLIGSGLLIIILVVSNLRRRK